MKLKMKYVVEGLLYALAGGLLFFALASIDAFELFYEFSRAHESWEIDEIILLVPITLFVVSIFAVRRVFDLTKTTRELRHSQKQMAEARMEIESLMQAREEFMAVACHQLKNPINGILSALKLIEMADDRKEVDELSALAKEAGVGLRAYATDILDVTRLVVGHRDCMAEEFSPRQMMEEAISSVRFKANDKQLDFDLSFDAAMPEMLQGHPAHLRHVVQNLADNAVKYTPSGYVHIRCYHQDFDDLNLVVQVADSGPGIAKDLQEAIFQPYHQVPSQGHTRQGVGLGLSIVKQLTEIMGGDIQINSDTGEGTTFTVTVPIKSA